MTTSNDFHNRAMEFAEQAFMARVKGNSEASTNLSEKALQYELDAIEALGTPTEPTYSVLHRSAGWMAFNSGQIRKAEQIVANALAHDPHPEIAEELRDLLEQIHFQRHLNLKGITLEEGEMQLSLSGRGVGFGIVSLDEIVTRSTNSSKLIYRIVERRSEKSFRERGRLGKIMQDGYELFVSPPRAASFSVTLKLGRPSKQPFLPGISDTENIIDEFMELMALANRAGIAEIEKRIPDPAYRMNFLGLAKKIAPDGEEIRQVGFTTIRDGSERSVQITRPAREFPRTTSETPSHDEPESVEIRGVLRYADSIRTGDNKIKIIDQENKRHSVTVPEGMMNDIVRPMWDLGVIVKGKHHGKEIMLEDIREE